VNPQAEWQSIVTQTGQYLKDNWPEGLVLQDTGVLAALERPVARARKASTKDPDTQALVDFFHRIKTCTRCPLGASRTHFVFGSGNPQADVMFIGEAPGREEDLAGKPFVGEAGRLLTKIIEAIHFTRDQVFIANILKCRPPGNRDPKPEEINQCKGYLLEQIKLIKPKVICTLGRFAAQTLLGTSLGMLKLRGQVHQFNGLKLIATFHPAALLRNPQWKRLTWEDVQLLRKIYDSEVAAHG
jgi:DNA polymerase